MSTLAERRSYRAETLEDALRQVREELGPHAMVVRQREGVIGGVGGFFGRRCVELEVEVPDRPSIDVHDTGDEVSDDKLLRTLFKQSSPFAGRLAEAVAREPAAEEEPKLAWDESEFYWDEADDDWGRVPESAEEPRREPLPRPRQEPEPEFEAEQWPAPERHPAPHDWAAEPETAPVAQPAPQPARRPEPAPAAVLQAEPQPLPEPLPAPQPVAVPEPEPAPEPVAVTELVVAPAAQPAPPPPPLFDPAATLRQLVRAGLEETLARELIRESEAERRLFDPTTAFDAQVRIGLAQRIRVKRGARRKHRRIALVGPAGSGKTLTAIRLCHAYRTGAGASVAALSLEPAREALELGRRTQNLGVEFALAPGIDELRLVLSGLPETDLLVVDTPALDPADAEALAALGGLLAAVEPDEIHLLLPASLGAGEATALVETVAPVLGVDRLLLTHLDAPTAGATGVAASLRTRLPISFTATGRAWGLRPADPCELARLVLP